MPTAPSATSAEIAVCQCAPNHDRYENAYATAVAPTTTARIVHSDIRFVGATQLSRNANEEYRTMASSIAARTRGSDCSEYARIYFCSRPAGKRATRRPF